MTLLKNKEIDLHQENEINASQVHNN